MTNTGSRDLEQVLRFDPLAAAEKLTGESYKVDRHTEALGMMMHIEHARNKEATLRSNDDTTLSNDLDRYLRIIQELGFEQVLTVPFTGYDVWSRDELRDECLHIWAHRDGLLLKFDTFNAVRVNGATVYYNWQPHDLATGWECTSSGHYHELDRAANTGLWSGDHDAREALRHKLQRLRDNGEFLARWKDRPFLWLLHYMDTKQEGYDCDAINAARIAQLPEWVQTMVTPEA